MPSLSLSKDALPDNCGYSSATDTTKSLAGFWLQVSSTASIKMEKTKKKKCKETFPEENVTRALKFSFCWAAPKKRPFLSTDCKDKSAV